MNDAHHDRRAATAAGLVAVLLWSATIAVSRHLADEIGALTAAACTFLAAGVLGCAWAAAKGELARMVRLPPAYLAACGACFVAYMICLYFAIGLAGTDQQAIEVAVLNYLWPSLTLALSVLILHVKVRPAFWLGVVAALAGAALAPLRLEAYSAAALGRSLAANPLPYVLAAAAAVLWALYSVLSRRLAGDAEGGAVPLFALAAGVALAALRPVLHEPTDWSLLAAGELAFMAIFPALIAYAFWDRAMRRGNATLVAAASYGIPLVSTILSSLYLGVALGPTLWVACGLVVAGAVVSSRSVRKESAECGMRNAE